jgi:preprotein translocase subunit SecG
MENVVLTIHLILAFCLIGVVLLQRSEGGGLGMGGGGGGAMSGRAAATALTKLTWVFAVGFIITSISLTMIAAQNSAGSSVVDQFGGTAPAPVVPVAPLGTDLLPPSKADAPLTPPRADDAAPAAPADTVVTPPRATEGTTAPASGN